MAVITQAPIEVRHTYVFCSFATIIELLDSSKLSTNLFLMFDPAQVFFFDEGVKLQSAMHAKQQTRMDQGSCRPWALVKTSAEAACSTGAFC